MTKDELDILINQTDTCLKKRGLKDYEIKLTLDKDTWEDIKKRLSGITRFVSSSLIDKEKVYKGLPFEFGNETMVSICKKNEPKYRPFKDCRELISTWENMIGYKAKPYTKPLIWVKVKSNTNNLDLDDYIGDTVCITSFENYFVRCDIANPDMEVLFDDFTFLDGSPCGIKED